MKNSTMSAECRAEIGEQARQLPTPRSVTIDYINHKGVRALRVIEPSYLWWGQTEWHKGEQWLLHAWDFEKNAARDFAWNGIRFNEHQGEEIVAQVPIDDPQDRLERQRNKLAMIEFYEWCQREGHVSVLDMMNEMGLMSWPRTRGRV